MDNVALLAASGLMAAQDMYMLMDTQNGTEAPTAAPTAAPAECPISDFKGKWFDNGDRQWQFFTLFLILGFLATWVRRSRNQRAVMLGVAVEGLFAFLYAVGALLVAAVERRCIGGDAPQTSLVVAQIAFVLARIGQVAAGFMAQRPNSQKAAGALMVGASFVYWFAWLTFMAQFVDYNYFKTIMNPFNEFCQSQPCMAPIGYATVRSGLIALVGVIFFLQSDAESENEGVEMP